MLCALLFSGLLAAGAYGFLAQGQGSEPRAEGIPAVDSRGDDVAGLTWSSMGTCPTERIAGTAGVSSVVRGPAGSYPAVGGHSFSIGCW